MVFNWITNLFVETNKFLASSERSISNVHITHSYRLGISKNLSVGLCFWKQTADAGIPGILLGLLSLELQTNIIFC